MEDGIVGEGTGHYSSYYEKVGKEFLLKAEGRPDLRAYATRGYWMDVERNDKDFYLRFDPDEFERMAFGVVHELVYAGDDMEYRWIVRPGIEIIRGKR